MLVGLGPRGERHAEALRALPDRFALVAVCDLDPARREAAAARLGPARAWADAEAMLAAERPDVLCFVTPPRLRWPLVAAGLRHGVRAIAFEKPLALSLAEARCIVEGCAAAGVRAVVCHQLRFAAHWQATRTLVAEGALGEVHALHATGRPSMLRVGTHLVDLVHWLNGEHPAAWVLGQAHGAGAFAEDHPCPDHLAGFVAFANGTRGILEVGALAPRHLGPADFWNDVAVTVYGRRGWVRTVLGAGWEAVTEDGRRAGPADLTPAEPAFYAALADWLDDPARQHPCRVEVACAGLEVLLGMALSSLERRRVDLPFAAAPEPPVLARLEAALGGAPLGA